MSEQRITYGYMEGQIVRYQWWRPEELIAETDHADLAADIVKALNDGRMTEDDAQAKAKRA